LQYIIISKSLEFNSVSKYVTRNIHIACLVKVRIQRWWYSWG